MPIELSHLPNGQTARAISVADGENFDDLMTQAGYKTEKEVSVLKKELRMFLTGMNKQFPLFAAECQAMFNPHVIENWSQEEGADHETGHETVRGTTALNWFNSQAMPELLRDLKGKRKQKIDGKDWAVGFLGSRWSDRVLGGVPVRVCFYSKKNNPQILGVGTDNECPAQYVLMIDPHELDSFGPAPSADNQCEECDFCQNPRFRLTKRVGDAQTPPYDEWTCQQCHKEQYEEEYECEHEHECGCGKQNCFEMDGEDCSADAGLCENEACRHYYDHRNDNCDCGGNECPYC